MCVIPLHRRDPGSGRCWRLVINDVLTCFDVLWQRGNCFSVILCIRCCGGACLVCFFSFSVWSKSSGVCFGSWRVAARCCVHLDVAYRMLQIHISIIIKVIRCIWLQTKTNDWLLKSHHAIARSLKYNLRTNNRVVVHMEWWCVVACVVIYLRRECAWLTSSRAKRAMITWRAEMMCGPNCERVGIWEKSVCDIEM